MDKSMNVREIQKDNGHLKERMDASTDRNHRFHMKQILKPVLYGLALAGCYHFKDSRQKACAKMEKRCSVKSVLSTSYRLLIFAILCLSVCRVLVACFYSSSGHTKIYVQYAIWLLYNLLTFLIFVKTTSRRYGHNEKAFDSWKQQIAPLLDQLCIQYPETKMKRRSIVALVLCFVSVFVNIIGAYLQVKMSHINIYVAPFENNNILLTIGLAVFGLETFVWMMPMATIVIISMFVKEAFFATNQYLVSICENGNLESFENFEKGCRLHLHLCNLVGLLDKELKWYLGTSVVFNVGLCIFILYQIMRTSLDNALLILFIIWFLVCMFNVTISILHAALLHEVDKKMEKVQPPDIMDDLYENKVVPAENNEDNAENEKTTFNIEKTCLKHVLLAMTISGNYNPCKRKKYGILITLYRIFILLAILAFTAKTISGFFYISDKDFFGHGIVLTWNVSCLFMFLLTLRMNHSSFGNQERTFRFWNTTIGPQMEKLGIKFDRDSFRKRQIFLCCAGAGFITILLLFSALQLTGILGSGNTAMMTTPFENTPSTCFLQMILIAACGFQANIPALYMVVIFSLLTRCFRGFNEYLHKKMCQDGCRLPQTIQKIREFYTDLCKIVKDFDRDFQYLLGNLCFWNITLGLFTLYVLLHVNDGSYGLIAIIAYTFWLFLSMAIVVIVSVFAALVHEAAHAPLDSIYYINVQDITVEKLAQLNLFLSKLTGTQVGFSTCGLLIITKEFILTIAGVFLTYFAVLYTL